MEACQTAGYDEYDLVGQWMDSLQAAKIQNPKPVQGDTFVDGHQYMYGAVCLQSNSCRRLSRALLRCIPHPSLGLDVACLRLVGGVASWRTCLGVSATCSTLLQQRTMTRTNLLAATPYCSEHMVAQVACVVQLFRLPLLLLFRAAW